MDASELRDLLVQASTSGEILTIKYHGGSQPGTTRQISPMTVADSKVRARCLTSDAVKVFVIDKIEIVQGGVPSKTWNPEHKPETHYQSLEDVFKAHESELKAMGWHVQFEENSLTLHKVRKNGTPLKKSEVALSFKEWTYDEYFDGETWVRENERKVPQPYHASAQGHTGGNYKYLDKAVDKFLLWARQQSPNQ